MKKKKESNTFNASLYSEFNSDGFKKSTYKAKRTFNVKRALLALTYLVLGIAIVTVITLAIRNQLANSPDIEQLETFWALEDYESTYTLSNTILSTTPFNNTALTYNGYSAFYLALASTDSQAVHDYIDEAINSLRLALLDAHGPVTPQLEYMLGKTYFHKNRLSAYYFYSDLAIKYLHSAHNNGYNASDIYEYLGLCYASLDMNRESIAYFTEALLVNDSDVLQVAIAEQYYKVENYDAAKPYLEKVKNESDNVEYKIQSSNLLGQIYIQEENYDEAQIEFEHILEINERSADAHYGLGIIYEKQGDFVKARAQWRRALEFEVNHQGARLKLQ